MTPFGHSVARELRAAIVPLETASIADHAYLEPAIRALLKNALFYVVPTPAIKSARNRAAERARALAEAIQVDGVRTQGISLAVDLARDEATLAMQEVADAVADAEPTVAARSLGIA